MSLWGWMKLSPCRRLSPPAAVAAAAAVVVVAAAGFAFSETFRSTASAKRSSSSHEVESLRHKP